MPLPSPSFSNNLQSWTAQYDMKGSYTASVDLTNEQQQYTHSALLYSPLKLDISLSSVTKNVASPSCFSGSLSPVYGIITEFSSNESLAEKTAQLGVKSFFFRMGKKAINTEHFVLGAKSAMELVFSNYLGVPSGLWDFTETKENRTFGPVTGNNLIDELRQLAQAGESTVFIAEDGLLRTRAWKDASSAVDVVIPDEAIKSCSIARQDDSGPTRIRIRGGFISAYQRGLVPYLTWSNPCAMGRVPMVWCLLSGMPVTDYPVDVYHNAPGDAPLNGRFTINGYGTSASGIFSTGNVSAPANIAPAGNANPNHRLQTIITGPSNYLGPGPHSYTVEPRGFRRDKLEWENPNAKLKALRQNQAHLARGGIATASVIFGAGPNYRGGPAGGAGVRSSGYNLNNDRESDESEGIQLELVVDDPGLQAKYGIITEQIENRYVKDKTLLFRIAVRRFQEVRMERVSWEVDLVPLACLKLNDKVTFNTPETQHGGSTTVTGLVPQIGMSYNAENHGLTQKLIVESMEDIGSTTYQATDLTSDNSFSSVDYNDWWSVNIPALSDVTAGNGGFRLVSTGGDPSVTLSEHNFQYGATYNVQFDADQVSGATMQFSITDTTPSILLPTQVISSGTNSYSFTILSNSAVNMFWHLTGAGEWTLSNLKITQTLLA